MKSMLKVLAAGAVAGALSVSLHGAAGVLIVETTTSAGVPSTNRIQLESNRMRAEASGSRGEKQIVIFDGAKQVLLMIDDQNKTYTELTKEDADALGAQMSQAMAQIQKQLEGLPPEQRAQIESMMKGRMGGAGGAPPKTVYKRVGSGTVGKWSCTKYEGFEGETKTSELCTVDPKTFGLAEADFAVTKQFIEFFKRVVPAMATQMFVVGSAEQQGFEGVPVRRTSTVLGRTVTSEITEVSRQTFPDTSYAVPAGYQKRSFGSFGASRR